MISKNKDEIERFQRFVEDKTKNAVEQNGIDVNDSGQGKESTLPNELTGLNWGAAILSIIWGVAMKMPFGFILIWFILLSLPVVGLLFAVVFLFKGNEWAWQYRKWKSIEEFRTVQKKWTKNAFIALVTAVVLVMLFMEWITRISMKYISLSY